MWSIYDLIIHLYGDAISIAALFKPKARMWVAGRKGLLGRIESSVVSRQSEAPTPSLPQLGEGEREGALAWFHCASLGEFEQGRPVIEAFRIEHPDWKILLTFFSPSGYEIRKNYDGADYIFYLPLDTPWNARKFINLVRPSLVVFVKYEFWFRYLDVLHRNNIPVYVISAIFRTEQHFFKWYGGWARNQLRKVTRFFVQDDQSEELLRSFRIEQVSVSGDTRFDRVAAVARNARSFPLVEKFAGNQPVFLAGSTWPADEELIMNLIGTLGDRMKFIIAPHEVGVQRVASLQLAVGQLAVVNRQSSVISRQSSVSNPKSEISNQNSELRTVLFSQFSEEKAESSRVLIIDGIGYLSHLYQYATIAYIGGGFGSGIHNILEAAAFGKPVIFGPKYDKFHEAVDLIKAGGAFSISNSDDLSSRTEELLGNPDFYKAAAGVCHTYVKNKTGATKTIIDALKTCQVSVGHSLP